MDDPSNSRAGRLFVTALAALLAAAVVAALVFRPRPAPPDSTIADDPLLARGHELYHQRCASCHGPSGRGDGPIAAMIKDPPPGDLSDGRWRYGDRPEQVTRVIARGVPGTGMAGWSAAFAPPEIDALAAYVYHLAGRRVPDELRATDAAPASGPGR